MRKVLCILVSVLMMLFSNIANAANIKDHPRVAVMQFGNKAIMSDGLKNGDFAMCSEYAIYQLLASDWFDLIDYEQLTNIAKMHSINMSGLVDQSTVVQLGKFASAQFMVVGNVTGLTLKASGLGVEANQKGSVNGNKNTVTANVVMRIVDIETGRIVAAGMGNGSSSSTNLEIKFKKYRKNSNTVINDNAGVGGGDLGEESESETLETSETPQETEQQENLLGDENAEADSYAYTIKIGTSEVADVQVRNALGKAVRDAVYGRAGLMTMLNGGKPLKIKTGF